MACLRSNSLRRGAAITAILALLLLRAWVPVGFMPSQGGVFRLQLCQADRPLASSPANHGDRGHGHGDPCPFGSSPPPGPIAQIHAFEPARPLPSLVAITIERQPIVSRLLRAQAARGPPRLV
jgi:hypothetical protein